MAKGEEPQRQTAARTNPARGWQEPRRGWPERVAAARRRERRVAASSWAQLSLGGGWVAAGVFSAWIPRWPEEPGAGGRDGQESCCRPQLLCLELCVCKGFPGQLRLRSGGGCRQCPPGGHPSGDGRSAPAAAAAGNALRPIYHRQRDGRIRARRLRAREAELLCREPGPV